MTRMAGHKISDDGTHIVCTARPAPPSHASASASVPRIGGNIAGGVRRHSPGGTGRGMAKCRRSRVMAPFCPKLRR